MKLFIKKFLGLIIIVSSILLMLSFNIKKIVVNTLNETVIKNIVTNELVEVIKKTYPEVSSSNLTSIKNKIVDSNEFNKITSIYFDNIVYDITNNTTSKINITNELKTIAEDSLDIVPQYKDEIIKRIDNIDFTSNYKKILNYSKEFVNNRFENILEFYNILNNIKTKLLLGLIILISIITLIIINKGLFKSFKSFSKVLSITSIIQILFALAIRSMFMGLNVTSIVIISIIEFILSFILDEIYERKLVK